MKFSYKGRIITAGSKIQAIKAIIASGNNAGRRRSLAARVFTEEQVKYSDVQCPFCGKQDAECTGADPVNGDGCDALHMACRDCGKSWKTVRQLEEVMEPSCPECGSTDVSDCGHTLYGDSDVTEYECNDCQHDFSVTRELVPVDIEYEGN